MPEYFAGKKLRYIFAAEIENDTDFYPEKRE